MARTLSRRILSAFARQVHERREHPIHRRLCRLGVAALELAGDIARRSTAAWLDQIKADAELRETATGLRGFFLADPDELSLIALVDQFAGSDGALGSGG